MPCCEAVRAKRGDGVRGGREHAAFAGRQVLGGVEAEAGDVGRRRRSCVRPTPLRPRAPRLR